MKRIFALAAGVILSVVLIAPVSAVSGSGPGNEKGGKQGQIKQTPKAAKAWHEREKKRYAARKRAAAMRQKQLSKKSGIQNPQAVK